MEATVTPIGEMRMAAPGVLVHQLSEGGVTVTEDAATEVKRITERLAGGDPVVVIVDMRTLAFADRNVRNEFGSAAGGVEVATGLVVEQGMISGELAELFIKFHDPDRPVEVFGRVPEAMAWARTLLERIS